MLFGGLRHCQGSTHAMCSFTYSKSPGLLSMPTFGGAIHEAYWPGSKQGFISDWMKSPSALLGSQSRAFASYSAPETSLPSGPNGLPAKTPILRLNPSCGSFISNLTPTLSMILFQRPTPPAASRV